jgi:hypothetical protein
LYLHHDDNNNNESYRIINHWRELVPSNPHNDIDMVGPGGTFLVVVVVVLGVLVIGMVIMMISNWMLP